MAEATAHAKGAAKQAAQVLKGQTGIYSTLAKEHGEVSSLLKQALKATSSEKRQQLMNKIRIELLSHARAEQETLYSALGQFDVTRDLAQHNWSEHDTMERMLMEVANASDGSHAETDALENLRGLVESHAEEEEQVMFVRANDVLSSEEESRLDAAFKERKESEKRALESDGVGWAKGPVH